jgi:hypothetical protein
MNWGFNWGWGFSPLAAYPNPAQAEEERRAESVEVRTPISEHGQTLRNAAFDCGNTLSDTVHYILIATNIRSG